MPAFAQSAAEIRQRLRTIENTWAGAAARLNHHAVNRYAGSASDAAAAVATESMVNLRTRNTLRFERLFDNAVRLGAAIRSLNENLRHQNLSAAAAALPSAEAQIEALQMETDAFFRLQETATDDAGLALGAAALLSVGCLVAAGPITVATTGIYSVLGGGLSVINTNNGNLQYDVDPRLAPASTAVNPPTPADTNSQSPQPQAVSGVSATQDINNRPSNAINSSRHGHDPAMQAYRDQMEYQRLLSLRVRQPLVVAAHVRTIEQLITEAQEALPVWHNNGSSPRDWGRFLIEADAAQSQPPLSQREYDGLLDIWQEGQERARRATRGISDPLLQARAVANSWMQNTLRGNSVPQATLRQCLHGERLNSSCSTKFIIASLQALPLNPPNGHTLAVQVFADGMQPVFWERSTGRTINLITGEQSSTVRGEIYHSAFLDHSFLTEQRTLGQTVALTVPVQDLFLAAEAPPQPLATPHPQTSPAPTTTTATEARTTAAATQAPTQAPTRTPQVDGPPARLRSVLTINNEIRRGLIQWQRTGQIPFDWAALSIETEAVRLRPIPSQSQYDNWLEIWRQRYQQTSEALSATSLTNTDPVARIGAVRDALIASTIGHYARDSASLITSISDQGGNCQTSTQLLATAILRNGLAPPPGEQFAIQVFGDHVQFVTYNPQTGVVWDILSNTRTSPLRGDLFSPALMAHAYLSAYGAGVDTPFPAERLIIARSQLPEEARNLHPELARGMRNNLGWPSARQNFSPPEHEVPAFATIPIPSRERGEVQTEAQPHSSANESNTNGPQTPNTAENPPITTRDRRVDSAMRLLVNWKHRGAGVFNSSEYRAFFLGNDSTTGLFTEENFNLIINRSVEMYVQRFIQKTPPSAAAFSIVEQRQRFADYCVALREYVRGLANPLFTAPNARPRRPGEVELGAALTQRRMQLRSEGRSEADIDLETAPLSDSGLCRQAPYRNALDSYHLQRLRLQAAAEVNNQRGAIGERRFQTLVERMGQLITEPVDTRNNPPSEYVELWNQFIRARLQSRPEIERLLSGLHPQDNIQNLSAIDSELASITNGNLCRVLASPLATAEMVPLPLQLQEHQPRVEARTNELVRECESLPMVAQLRDRIAAYRNRIQTEPLATLAAISLVSPTREATPLISLARRGRAQFQQGDTELPFASQSPGVLYTFGNNTYLHPLLNLIYDRRRVAVAHRPHPTPVPSVAAETTPTAPATPSSNAGGGHPEEIEFIVVEAPEATHPAAPAPRSIRPRHRPGQIRMSVERFTELILGLDTETQDNGLIRNRWTPEMTRFLAHRTSPLAAVLRRSYAKQNLRALVEVNPGPIPGPFGHSISRNLAQVIFQLALDDLDSGGPQVSPRHNSPTFWIDSSVASRREGYFPSVADINRFIELLNTNFSREFGGQRIPSIQ